MFLEEIINSVVLENDTIEYKGQLNQEDVVSWLKTIAGFANAKGGTLFLGVEDKTHKLIGYERKKADTERNYFNNQVNEHLTPRPPIDISFIRYTVNSQERFVIQVTVKESNLKPVILKYNGVPSIYMRRSGFTNGATLEEIIEMGIKSQNYQYDTLFTDIPYSRDNFTKLFQFYSKHNNDKVYSDKALKSIGFFNEHSLLANGALLFSDDYHNDKTKVMCSVFSGKNKGSERIVTVNRYNTNLINSITDICDFVEQRMNHSIIKMNDGRKNIDAFPKRALFEGVINAIAHRDYFLDGTQIQVDMFQDRLEISSPGSFYKGEEIKKTYNLSSIISKRRNELICAVLVACNVMEAAGTGFDKIVEEYIDADLRHKPYIYSSSDHFTLVLPDLTYEDGITDESLQIMEYLPIPHETSHDKKILSFCYDNARKAKEIADYLGISDSTYLRKRVLENMVKENYLLTDSTSRTAYYRTNPQMASLKAHQ